MNFPEPKILQVDKDGKILLNIKQWKFCLKLTKSKAKTYYGQYKAIKKLFIKALEQYKKK